MTHKKCNFRGNFLQNESFKSDRKSAKKIPDKGDAWDWMRYV